MRNFLIFLGIIAVGYLAVLDTMERFEELEKISVATPSQVEMKRDLKTSDGSGVKSQKYPPKQFNTMKDEPNRTNPKSQTSSRRNYHR